MRIRGDRPNSIRRALGVVAVVLIVATACDPGAVAPIAGTGASGSTGDGGPATSATFESPGGITSIPGGGYYVVDDDACVIRKVDASGTVSTIAGTGTCGYAGDSGPATAAQIDPALTVSPNLPPPYGSSTERVPSNSTAGQIALDSAGNLYLVDTANNAIRKIDPSGTITTLVTDPSINVPPITLDHRVVPASIAVTNDDTVYLAGINGVSEVLPDGTLVPRSTGTVHAIAPAPGGDLYLGVDGPTSGTDDIVLLHPDGTTSPYATASRTLTNLAVAPDGTLYGAQGNVEVTSIWIPYVAFSEEGSNRIARYGPGTETIIAGTGDPDPATGTQSTHGPDMDVTPQGLAIAADGSLLFSSGHAVYKLNDPSQAAPWNGTSCNPAKIHPGADLSNTDLTGIDLRRCDLSGVNLTNTVLAGTNLDGSHGTDIIGTPASLPTGYALVNGVLTGPGTNYTDVTLDGIDLSGANFAGATFTGAHLWGTNFTGANLSGAVFDASDLHQTDFHGADLTGATVANNIVNDDGVRTADFTDADLTDLNTNGATILSLVAPVFTGANVEGANLTAIRQLSSDPTLTSGGVTGTPILPSFNLTLARGYLITSYADLTDADLTNLDLTNGNLAGTTLTGTDLTGATLTNVQSGSITGTPAALPTDWLLVNGYLVGPGANLTDADLAGADLTGATLTGARLTNAILTGANLSGADLTGVTLTGKGVRSGSITGTPAALPANWDLVDGYLIGPGAFLEGADLSGADLSTRDLTGSYLPDADLTGANLTGTTVTGTTLTNADLTGATLTGVTSGSITGTPTALPTDWLLVNGSLVGPGANLTNANLTGADLTGVDLTGATLTGVKSGSITGTPTALPTDWLLVNGYLVGPDANLIKADLTGADLTGANLSGADLSVATLTGVKSGSITGIPSHLPTAWKLRSGYLIGPGANLTNANLVGANLGYTNVSGADLTGADLTDATLTGVFSGSITGTPAALPTGWKLINGYLVGPGANLAGANFSNANLAGTNLANASLTYATLTGVKSGSITGSPSTLPTGWTLVNGYLVGPGANLTNANLAGADLTGVDLTAANLSYANLTNTNLTNATLDHVSANHATITGADLTGADLTRLRAGALTGTPAALPASWALRGGFLVGPNAAMTGFGMTGVDLSGLDVTGADANHTTFTNANLTGTTLANVNLTSAVLTGADLTNADFTGATGTPSGGSTATYAGTTCPDATTATSPATCVGHGFGT